MPCPSVPGIAVPLSRRGQPLPWRIHRNCSVAAVGWSVALHPQEGAGLVIRRGGDEGIDGVIRLTDSESVNRRNLGAALCP